jgi:hypothetical protein
MRTVKRMTPRVCCAPLLGCPSFRCRQSHVSGRRVNDRAKSGRMRRPKGAIEAAAGSWTIVAPRKTATHQSRCVPKSPAYYWRLYGPLLIQYGLVRQHSGTRQAGLDKRTRQAHDIQADRRGVLSCSTMSSSCGTAAVGSGNYTGLRLWTVACRPRGTVRGTVRGTARRIIPAQRVLSARWPVPSVQLARSVHGAVLLVNGRSAVRSRSPAPR